MLCNMDEALTWRWMSGGGGVVVVVVVVVVGRGEGEKGVGVCGEMGGGRREGVGGSVGRLEARGAHG